MSGPLAGFGFVLLVFVAPIPLFVTTADRDFGRETVAQRRWRWSWAASGFLAGLGISILFAALYVGLNP